MQDTVGVGAQILLTKINMKLLEQSSVADDLKNLLPDDEPFLSAAGEQAVYAFITRVFIVRTIKKTLELRTNLLNLDMLNQLTKRKNGASDAWTVDAVIAALMERIRADVFMILSERRRPTDWKLSAFIDEMDNKGDNLRAILTDDILERKKFLAYSTATGDQ